MLNIAHGTIIENLFYFFFFFSVAAAITQYDIIIERNSIGLIFNGKMFARSSRVNILCAITIGFIFNAEFFFVFPPIRFLCCNLIL